MKKTIDSQCGTASLDQWKRVIRACTRPFKRSSATSEQNRSRSHGYEIEWEEAHNE
jgi:hypothetical protein